MQKNYTLSSFITEHFLRKLFSFKQANAYHTGGKNRYEKTPGNIQTPKTIKPDEKKPHPAQATEQGEQKATRTRATESKVKPRGFLCHVAQCRIAPARVSDKLILSRAPG